MKKLLLLSTAFAALLLTSCTKEGDTTLQPFNKIIFEENFNAAKEDLPPTPFDLPGWKIFAQVGTRNFTEQTYKDNGYAEFSAFGSGQLVNIGWLVSPQIDMDKQVGEILTFQAAQAFLRSRENILEVLASTNYDGTNVASADWVVVPAITPTPESLRYDFASGFSGEIDLTKFKGKLNFAFRVKGSGTNSNLGGTYQIDNVMMYYKTNEQN